MYFILDLPNDQLLQALKKESENPQANAAYCKLINRIVQEIETNQHQMQVKTDEATEYKNKIIKVYESYKHLEQGYREEHKVRLDLEDLRAIDDLRAEQQQEALQKAMDEISVLKTSMEQQKEMYVNAAKKQGVGRRNIEEKLMNAEIELDELRKKLAEQDAKLTRTASDAEFLRNENSQIKLLIHYLQNPAQQSTLQQYLQPQQQQQQQQQQTQQQQTQQPTQQQQQNPQHRNYNYTL